MATKVISEGEISSIYSRSRNRLQACSTALYTSGYFCRMVSPWELSSWMFMERRLIMESIWLVSSSIIRLQVWKGRFNSCSTLSTMDMTTCLVLMDWSCVRFLLVCGQILALDRCMVMKPASAGGITRSNRVPILSAICSATVYSGNSDRFFSSSGSISIFSSDRSRSMVRERWTMSAI